MATRAQSHTYLHTQAHAPMYTRTCTHRCRHTYQHNTHTHMHAHSYTRVHTAAHSVFIPFMQRNALHHTTPHHTTPHHTTPHHTTPYRRACTRIESPTMSRATTFVIMTILKWSTPKHNLLQSQCYCWRNTVKCFCGSEHLSCVQKNPLIVK